MRQGSQSGPGLARVPSKLCFPSSRSGIEDGKTNSSVLSLSKRRQHVNKLLFQNIELTVHFSQKRKKRVDSTFHKSHQLIYTLQPLIRYTPVTKIHLLHSHTSHSTNGNQKRLCKEQIKEESPCHVRGLLRSKRRVLAIKEESCRVPLPNHEILLLSVF